MDAKFKTHLFISYTHIDNLTTPDDSEGWVTRFHQYLKAYLSQRMGQEAQIWRDDRLRGDDVFAAQILKQFPQTAVLLSILSPRYLESNWCLKEVAEFCKTAETNGGLTVDDKARVLRAMLQAIPSEQRESLPEILRNALGYNFFEVANGERELPLDPPFGNGESYRRQVYFLADDIAKLLKKLNSPEGLHVEEQDSRATVYLAECGYDMREACEKMRGELWGLGYKVLPDQLARLPDSEAEYVTEVASLLNTCSLSIHVIGQSPGKILDGPSHKSVTRLQNELAAKTSANHALARVIWLPDGLTSSVPEQKLFIDAVQTDASMQYGADLVRSDFEAFKRVVYDHLERIANPIPPPTGRPVKLIYVICDEKDRQRCRPLRQLCRSQGFEVQIPAFSGDAGAVRQVNDNLLATCDALLIYYGEGGETWKRAIDDELIKMRAYRRAPIRASFTYLAAPVTDDKKDLIELREPDLIEGFDEFDKSSLDPLFQLLRA